jgi:hypothetical protein
MPRRHCLPAAKLRLSFSLAGCEQMPHGHHRKQHRVVCVHILRPWTLWRQDGRIPSGLLGTLFTRCVHAASFNRGPCVYNAPPGGRITQ